MENKPVSANALQSLSKIAESRNQNFAVTTDKAQIERIMAQNTKALFEDLNSPDYHDEIVEWFRFSDAQSNKHLDGLDFRCMNMPKLTYWMSAKMSWMMKTPVLSKLMAKVYRSQLGSIPTLGIISGGFWKPSDAIESGKFLIRFWLETAVHNLYIHPFGNLVTNQKAAKIVEQDLGIKDIWLIFKIGFSEIPPKSKTSAA